MLKLIEKKWSGEVIICPKQNILHCDYDQTNVWLDIFQGFPLLIYELTLCTKSSAEQYYTTHKALKKKKQMEDILDLLFGKSFANFRSFSTIFVYIIRWIPASSASPLVWNH